MGESADRRRSACPGSVGQESTEPVSRFPPRQSAYHLPGQHITSPIDIARVRSGASRRVASCPRLVLFSPWRGQVPTIQASEGSAITRTLATFTDPGGPGNPVYSATILWGDGQTSTVSTANGGIV